MTSSSSTTTHEERPRSTPTATCWEVSWLGRRSKRAPLTSFAHAGRQYKLHTFTSPMRANTNKLYMLSIDAARAAGFRDSLYFFRRNPLIHKLSCTQAEKDRLIDLGKLSGNLKSRAVTMVSARNCYKVMGAAFVLSEPCYEFGAFEE